MKLTRSIGTVIIGLLAAWIPSGCSKSSKSPTTPTPDTGALFVRSVPASAEVLLDGAATGSRTPKLLGGLSAVSHTIQLRMLGYADSVLAVTPTAGTTDTLSVSLRPVSGTPRSFAAWQDLGEIVWTLSAGPGGTVYATSYGSFWVFGSAGQTLTQAALSFRQSSFGLTVNGAGQAYFGYDLYIRKYSQAGIQLATMGTPAAFFRDPYPALGRGDTLWAVTRERDQPLRRYFGDTFHSIVWPGVDSTLYAITCNPSDGVIYALVSHRNLSAASKRIIMFAPNGQVLGQWPTAVRDAIALGPDGSVYVAGRDDASRTADGGGAGRVQRFSSSGGLLAEWGVENLTYTWSACGIPALAVDPSGTVYLSDYNGHRILKFTP